MVSVQRITQANVDTAQKGLRKTAIHNKIIYDITEAEQVRSFLPVELISKLFTFFTSRK